MQFSVLGLLLGAMLLVFGYGKAGQRRRMRGFILAGWIVLGVQVYLIAVTIIGCLTESYP
jgi:hypothetical protein